MGGTRAVEPTTFDSNKKKEIMNQLIFGQMFQAARLAAEKEAGEGAVAAVEAEAWFVTFVMRLREGGATRVKLLSSSRS